MNKIYAFRHSKTIDNTNKIFSGRRDVDLTKEGIRDAESLAIKLKDKNIDLAITSPMKRTKETLDIVLRYHPNTVVREDARIIERSYGLLEGQSKLVWAIYAYPLFKLLHRSYKIPPPGGESLKQVRERVMRFIDELVKEIGNKQIDVALSLHGNSIRAIREYFEGLNESAFNKIETKTSQLFTYDI